MRDSIKADEGYILTNGEVYGTEIFLAEGVSADDFKQITLEEYDALLRAEEEAENDRQATALDYQNALKELGVNL